MSTPIFLQCDRCGAYWREGTTGTPTQLRDNAKFAGWVQRRRYGAVRDYCPACAAEIQSREQARTRKRELP